jgi:hypothetical protein
MQSKLQLRVDELIGFGYTDPASIVCFHPAIAARERVSSLLPFLRGGLFILHRTQDE